MLKAILYLMIGAGVGALLGYANQCAGGSCPLMCIWWRGAVFGAVAGWVIYLAGRIDTTKRDAPDSKE